MTLPPIVSFDDEPLVLVNDADDDVGFATKQHCHDGEGLLHRAFSVFLFSPAGEVLLQQRSGQAFSTDLHVHFRKMLAVPQRYIGESRIERIEGRKVWTKGRLRAVDGTTVYVEAEGLYVEMVDRATLVPPQLV